MSRVLSYEREMTLACIRTVLAEMKRVDLRATEKVEWLDLVSGWSWWREERRRQ